MRPNLIDRYLVDGKEVTKEAAERAQEAVRETVHLHDGIIHRAWYRGGRIVEKHDLSLEGKPIRRLFYQDGKLARREYHDRHGRHVSTESFAPDGSLTESIQHGSSPRRWWYDRGVPTKYARGPRTYVKESTRWVVGQ